MPFEIADTSNIWMVLIANVTSDWYIFLINQSGVTFVIGTDRIFAVIGPDNNEQQKPGPSNRFKQFFSNWGDRQWHSTGNSISKPLHTLQNSYVCRTCLWVLEEWHALQVKCLIYDHTHVHLAATPLSVNHLPYWNIEHSISKIKVDTFKMLNCYH